MHGRTRRGPGGSQSGSRGISTTLSFGFASLQAGMRQYLASYAYSNASAEQLLQVLMAALLEGAAKQPATQNEGAPLKC